MTLKKFTYILIVLMASLFLASKNATTYKIIESNLPTILSAVLGGLLAAISIIVAVLSTASKEVKDKASENQETFESFTDNLRLDLQIIVICLILSILFPYLRNFEFKFSIEINKINIFDCLPYAISTFELIVLFISFAVISETIDVLIEILKNTFKLNK